jgi:hypothetical protein
MCSVLQEGTLSFLPAVVFGLQNYLFTALDNHDAHLAGLKEVARSERDQGLVLRLIRQIPFVLEPPLFLDVALEDPRIQQEVVRLPTLGHSARLVFFHDALQTVRRQESDLQVGFEMKYHDHGCNRDWGVFQLISQRSHSASKCMVLWQQSQCFKSKPRRLTSKADPDVNASAAF